MNELANHSLKRTWILFLFTVLCVSAGPAPRQTADIEGTWESKGMVNIIGGRTDRILKIAPSTRPAAKVVTMVVVHNPPWEERFQAPQAITSGPFEAQCDLHTLIVRYPSGLARYSFEFDGTTLNLPAFVRDSDKEISIETSEIIDLEAQRLLGRPPLTVHKWRWTFLVEPESAPRGTGHFASKVAPDPSKFSTEFDFDWEWREDRVGRRMVMWRRNEKGNITESGGFLVSQTGEMQYYSSGEDRVGPFDITCSYERKNSR